MGGERRARKGLDSLDVVIQNMGASACVGERERPLTSIRSLFPGSLFPRLLSLDRSIEAATFQEQCLFLRHLGLLDRKRTFFHNESISHAFFLPACFKMLGQCCCNDFFDFSENKFVNPATICLEKRKEKEWMSLCFEGRKERQKCIGNIWREGGLANQISDYFRLLQFPLLPSKFWCACRTFFSARKNIRGKKIEAEILKINSSSMEADIQV